MQLSPTFVNADEKHLVSLSGEFTLETRNEIPGLWNDFWSRGWQFDGGEEQAAYGVSYDMHSDGRFSYAAGRNIDPVPEELPEGACIVTLSPGRYAVFKNRGPVSELPALFDAIFSQWLPSSGKTQRDGAVFERYPYDDSASAESMAYEVWVPIME